MLFTVQENFLRSQLCDLRIKIYYDEGKKSESVVRVLQGSNEKVNLRSKK